MSGRSLENETPPVSTAA